MINEILTIFDETLSTRCWIERYGRLAITGKQKIGEKWKRFPVSTEAILLGCENLTEYLADLVPDDAKKGVAFWKALSQIKYSKVPGLSSNRRIRRADVTVQFLCWINVRDLSGVGDTSNLDLVMSTIINEAVKIIECRNQMTPTGLTGISNLTIDVVSIGGVEDWRKAMSGYTIENIEAITVWPFSAFTIDCKLSFLARQDCFEAFDCSYEVNCPA